ncbi:MAG: TraI domain-containing protein [Clostridia bacterium]|nr:TraI domain-containing protein [Clostridia bacterium]
MEYNKAVHDMRVGDEVEGFYILKEAYAKMSAAGKPFLNAQISDRSGVIDVKMWDYAGTLSAADAGKVIKIRGEISEYKSTLQLMASRIRLAEPEDRYDISALVPVAPVDIEKTYGYIMKTVSSITDADYRAVCLKMLERHGEAFRSIPAAKSVHHSFISGLLMHTANMLRTADFLSGVYGEIIDRSLLLSGTLLHDFAKDKEFCLSELGIVTDYSVKGQLLGHLVMCAQEVAELGAELGIPEEKSVLLQHTILSHHGEPEFGAAVRPCCAEAELLSYIDLIDSRMEIYAETFEGMEKGQFSGRVYALDKKIFNH